MKGRLTGLANLALVSSFRVILAASTKLPLERRKPETNSDNDNDNKP